MEKTEIIKTLKENLQDYSLPKMVKLIETLESDIRKENFIQKPSDKRRIATIEKVLKASEELRPLLSGWTKVDGQCAFTDSYQLYMLNDEYLPFNVSSTNENEEEMKKIAVEHNLQRLSGVYPTLKNVIPRDDVSGTYTLNINDFLAWYKSTPKSKHDMIYTIKTDIDGVGEISFNGIFMKNLIDILKLKDDFKLELYSNIKPIIVHNESGEMGIILPIRTY